MTMTDRPPLKPPEAIALVGMSYQRADAFFAQLVEEAKQEGLQVVCKEGCAACCAYVVHITPAESIVLAAAVNELPYGTRRAVVDRLAAWERAWKCHSVSQNGDRHGTRKETIVSWQVKQIACPLLDPESKRCLVYEDRPIACRVHHASTTNGTAEKMCETCPDVPAPEACITTEQHVRCGHAPWVWQLRNDLIQICGADQIQRLLDNNGQHLIAPSVLPVLVADAGRARYGWRSNTVVELPVIRP